MSGRNFDGLFESLEASFSAASASADRTAAEDLALSFRQDRSLASVLATGSWAAQLTTGTSSPIAAVGADYAETVCGTLIPLGQLVARRSTLAATPVLAQQSLVQRLREWVRAAAKVQVEGSVQRLSGHLISVGRDHLMIGSGGCETLLPLEAVERISRLRGSSTDAL